MITSHWIFVAAAPSLGGDTRSATPYIGPRVSVL